MDCLAEQGVEVQLNEDIYKVLGRKCVKKKCELEFSRAAALSCLSVLKKQTPWKLAAFDAVKDYGMAGIQWRKHLKGDVKICTNVADNLLETAKSYFMKNSCSYDDDNIRIVAENPQAHLHANKYTFIYAEVYGCALTYFDAMFSSIKHGGMLCVTSTDTALLQNKSPATSQRLYDAKMWKTEYHKEFGVRVIIGNLCKAASRWNKGIRVEMCAGLEHGFTIVCRVFRGSQLAEKSASYLRNVAHCQLCQAREFVPQSHFILETSSVPQLCECSSNGIKAPVLLLGPAWSGAICNEEFLYSILAEMRSFHIDVAHIKLVETLIIECVCCKTLDNEIKLVEKLKGEVATQEESPKAKRRKLDLEANLRCDKTASEISDLDSTNLVSSPVFYFDVQNHSVKGGNPPTVLSVINKLRSDGFSASKSHFGPRCIRTSANLSEFKAVLQFLFESRKK